MADVLGQSDDDPFSDCSIVSLLPRTLGGSISAGAAMSESDNQDFVGNLFKSMKMKNYTQLLDSAKLISDSSCSLFPNMGPEMGVNISAKRTFDNQIGLQGKRARQRRPGLSSIEKRNFIFNFPAETTVVEASQTSIPDFAKRRSSYAESKSQDVPVIDYSCLENITDPTEYFSTHRMLENAEKELRRLKGEDSPRLSQLQVRRDRQRRPGLPALEGKKYVFKFPDKFATMEASQMESATLSNGLNTSSCSKEISQTENSHMVVPERKLTGNAKNCDLGADKDFDELEKLLSKCRDLGNDEVGVKNILRETLQINPIQVEKLRGVWRSTRNMKKPTERDLYGLEHDNLCLPENTNVVDEQVEAPCNILNGISKNQRHLDASGGSRRKKFKRKEQILKRKSLAGVGTIWEAGVRRSTRIRMKPLQFWCGKRVLYGRVHDSLATVIGVKKFGTPLAGKNAEMKVKSFVSEQYADIVAMAALH